MSNVTLCINLCETIDPQAQSDDIVRTLTRTCQEAAFPVCERIYVGSYFCENFFLGHPDSFHEAVRETCARFEMGATLVIPIIGQAFLERATKRIDHLLEAYGDVYDEIVVNDVACFMDLAQRVPDKRLGIGRLFSKDLRDARYQEVFESVGIPTLSPEAAACIQTQRAARPLVEIDPTHAVVDVSELLDQASAATLSDAGPELAIHLPYCYATTGRNCGPASIDEPDSKKFQLGRGCSRHCLRMAQGSRVSNGTRYIKHGRTYYFENPGCQLSGTDSWRIIYAASSPTMHEGEYVG